MNISHDVVNQDTEFFNNNHDQGSESLTMFPAERPMRLLEIIPCDNPDQSYRYSAKLIGHDYTYIALSYCWGKTPDTAWMTKTDTVHQNMQDIDLKSLPATIRDCLWVATALGVHYVWVDSLCIIQDNISDWEIESAKMGGIYRRCTPYDSCLGRFQQQQGIIQSQQDPLSFQPFHLLQVHLCREPLAQRPYKSSLL